MKTVETSKRGVDFKEPGFFTLPENTLDVDYIELPGRHGGHSHQPDTALVLVRS